jgi:putative ABC transport system substrate-binding protein
MPAPRPILTIILTIALLATPLAATAQAAGPVPRVAYLSASSAASATWRVEAFRQGLRELGYIEGQNILIEYRWADGRFERLPALAADLARLKVRTRQPPWRRDMRRA